MSICIKTLPSLLTGGKGWYIVGCIYQSFGVFKVTVLSVSRHTVCCIKDIFFLSARLQIPEYEDKCQPVHKLAFAKTHKTGSSTLQNILFR